MGHSFTVRATDSSACTRDQPLQLIVAAAVPVMPPALLIALALVLFMIGALALQRARAAR